MIKPLDEITPRLLCFRSRLMRFNFQVKHIPGKDLVIPDSLSRNPVKSVDNVFQDNLFTETEQFVNSLTIHYSIKDYYPQKILNEQNKDFVCNKIK